MSPEVRQLVTELDDRLRAEYERQHPAFRLLFDGSLSATEQRMLEQGTFDEPR